MPSDKVHILPQSLINKIAAGEVIVRPASVVKELVENSVDAAPRRIMVDVTNACRNIKVTDDGCGIPDADLERIFEPFFSTKKETGGTGLGLSITYGIAQEIGGKIDVESELGKGTCFTVVLPLRRTKKGT